MKPALEKSIQIATAPAVDPETPGALTIVDTSPVEVAKLERQIAAIQGLIKRVMRQGVHYGTIPGCGDKFTLLKAGAEKIGMLFRLIPDPEEHIEDLGNGHREYRIITRLKDPIGRLMGFGVGSCSTMEAKYRYRDGKRKCPNCGKETIIKGKQEFGGGWLCFAKKGGCSSKFADGDPAIERQGVGKEENPDIADTYNTVYKMAKKRSLIDAILTATAASDIFEQRDDDDDAIDVTEESKAAASRRPVRPPTGQQFTYDLTSFDANKQANNRIFLTKNGCKEVQPNVWVCDARVASLDSKLVGHVAEPSTAGGEG